VTAIAYTGKDAVELASRVTATLAIVDVNLPDLDGVKVAGEICSRLPACKILLITGDPNSAPLLEWLKTGERKFEFLAKPFEPSDFAQNSCPFARVAKRGDLVGHYGRLTVLKMP
jgi:DNA-binding response OmpR family regulator